MRVIATARSVKNYLQIIKNFAIIIIENETEKQTWCELQIALRDDSPDRIGSRKGFGIKSRSGARNRDG